MAATPKPKVPRDTDRMLRERMIENFIPYACAEGVDHQRFFEMVDAAVAYVKAGRRPGQPPPLAVHQGGKGS